MAYAKSSVHHQQTIGFYLCNDIHLTALVFGIKSPQALNLSVMLSNKFNHHLSLIILGIPIITHSTLIGKPYSTIINAFESVLF